MKRKIYLLPGRGRALHEGLGAELLQRGHEVNGRALVGEFAKLFYPEQIKIIQEDIKSLNPQETKIIAISYGAYLYLQSQIAMPAFDGEVLLLSPIVGAVSNEKAGRVFIPPQNQRIKEAAKLGNLPLPSSLEIHVGGLDWQCPISDIKEIAENLNIQLNIVEGEGHRLGVSYVEKVLAKWL